MSSVNHASTPPAGIVCLKSVGVVLAAGESSDRPTTEALRDGMFEPPGDDLDETDRDGRGVVEAGGGGMSVLSTLEAFFLGLGAVTQVNQGPTQRSHVSDIGSPFWFSDM